jgi:geranylgeranyl diphosphate synthase type II
VELWRRGCRTLAAEVDRRLPGLLPRPGERPERVVEAMHYALTTPGKRAASGPDAGGGRDARRKPSRGRRSRLRRRDGSRLLAGARRSAVDGRRQAAPRPADDPRVYGEEVAILAALALLNRAYSLVCEAGMRLAPRRYSVADLAHHLANAIGTGGLIGGQALDLESRERDLDLERLEYIHSHKTGALFIAAAELGAMAAGARRRELDAVALYRQEPRPRLPDRRRSARRPRPPEDTGKDSQQDSHKVTFVKLLGVDGARSLMSELIEFAVEALAPLGKKAEPLRSLAGYVRVRER